jgi:hypothetical protein
MDMLECQLHEVLSQIPGKANFAFLYCQRDMQQVSPSIRAHTSALTEF